jgi:hypothetical protein
MTDAPLPAVLDRSRFVLEFTDGFETGRLAPDRWIDAYLPHWTTPPRALARYDLDADGLRLRIDADQPPWRDEDGPMRVSNLQTGQFSGPLGSALGTHRYTEGMVVRTEVPLRRLWTPSGGLAEATLTASADPTCMLAIWLVGLEVDSPADSGEITVAELFGRNASPSGSQLTTGVKALNDPRLTTRTLDVTVPFDTTEPHTYSAVWDASRVGVYVDDRLVFSDAQGMDYPLQLMISLFEGPDPTDDRTEGYPKTARVHRVRGYGWAGVRLTADAAPPYLGSSNRRSARSQRAG